MESRITTAVAAVISLSLHLSARAQTPTAPPAPATGAFTEGTAMEASAIAEKWKPAPPLSTDGSQPLPFGLRTRSVRPTSPAAPPPRARSVGLSAEALKANKSTFLNLISRGMKPLYGSEAVAAQIAKGMAEPRQQPREESTDKPAKSVAPSAFVQIPVVAEKQIAFRLHFKLDSTEFDDVAQGTKQAAIISAAMKSLPETTCFLIEGHTCDLGEASHNQKLSESRALAIRTLLAGLGVNPRQLLAVGIGEREPETPNSSEPNRSLNRRVVIGPIELPVSP